MKRNTNIFFRLGIAFGFVFLLIFNSNRVIGQVTQVDTSLIRFDGCYILDQLWKDRVDSTSTSFIFSADGKAAKISTPVDKNPFHIIDTVNESRKESYYNMLNKGTYEIVSDTLFVETKWYMYGILGGKEYNRYYFRIKNKNELIYLGSWTKKKRKSDRILRPISDRKTANFLKLKEKPIFTKGR